MYRRIRWNIISNKLVQSRTTIWFIVYRICFNKYVFITKHLTVFMPMYWLASIIHCISSHFTSHVVSMNIRSTLYLCAKVIIANLTNFLVVAFSVKAFWAKLIPHVFLRFSGVFCECLSLYMKVLRGCDLISVIGPGYITGCKINGSSLSRFLLQVLTAWIFSSVPLID